MREFKCRTDEATSGEPPLPLAEHRLAYAALKRLRRQSSCLVFLYGPSGVGKSHLLRQFLREVELHAPAGGIVHLTASDFAARLGSAARSQTVHRFQQYVRETDLLAVEDLGSLSRRPESQQQLVHAIDSVLQRGGRCLLTATRLPGEFEGLLPRLVNRCHGGTCIAMPLPGPSTREALILHAAARRQIPLPRSAAALLAERLPVSPRELQAAVLQLDACGRLEGAALDTDLVRRFLDGEVKSQEVTIRQIGQAVARQFGIPLTKLRAGDRQQGHVLPRQCAMLLARELTSEPLSRIAAYFGRKNHSTVVYACNRVRRLTDDEPALRRHLTRVRQQLGTLVNSQTAVPRD